jgi:hypothetical protein
VNAGQQLGVHRRKEEEMPLASFLFGIYTHVTTVGCLQCLHLDIITLPVLYFLSIFDYYYSTGLYSCRPVPCQISTSRESSCHSNHPPLTVEKSAGRDAPGSFLRIVLVTDKIIETKKRP